MKRLVSLFLVVTFGSLCGAAPVLGGEGPSYVGESGTVVAPAQTAGPAGGTVAGEKNPKLAGLMSLAVPCTGQIYNGELMHWKTAAMAAIEGGSIFVLVFFLATDYAKGVAFAGMGGMIANHLWSGWDAWNTAKKMNQGVALEMEKNRTMVSYNIPF